MRRTPWERFLTSGLVATSQTLIVNATYTLFTEGHDGTVKRVVVGRSALPAKVKFYAGVHKLEVPAQSHNDHNGIEVVVGDLVVCVGRYGNRGWPEPMLELAARYRLAEPEGEQTPLYACVHTSNLALVNVRFIRRSRRRPPG